MDDDIFMNLDVLNSKAYSNKFKQELQPQHLSSNKKTVDVVECPKPLTTKVAVKFLLEGRLKSKVCRYCLHVTPGLSELDQVMKIGGTGNIYKVTIRDIVASFHPFKVVEDPNFPNRICQKCIDKALGAYLFTQQCERAERAMLNCFDDMYEKLEKLDPINPPKKRGRQKLNPNHNILHAEHYKVMDYAEPIINIINVGGEMVSKEPELNDLECKKCWQVLPNLESLMNHEKIHPKTMWYHCRLCGKSFPKCNQLKRHNNRVHVLGKEPIPHTEKDFKCQECTHVTDNCIQHLQHVEKHKFKNIMQHLIEKRMDKLCVVCYNKGTKMMDLDKMVCIHGGHPDLMGDKTLYTLLATTLPNMNHMSDYIGTKICDKCRNQAIISYIFLHQFNFARERLYTCVSLMLDNINKITPHANVFVQISPQTIMPAVEDTDETLLLDENDYIDESKLKVDVLEDEFRIKSESESENESITEKPETTEKPPTIEPLEDIQEPDFIDNPAKNATKAYKNNKLFNGLRNNYSMDICSEFLKFNNQVVKKVWCKFTCPLCYKHFISDYFLKRHILKHINKKVKCTICHTQYNSKFYLYEHKKIAHLLKKLNYMSCKVCGRSFLSEAKLYRHEKLHKATKCQLCNKVFGTQTQYTNHIQRHAVKLKLINQKHAQTCSFCEKECPNHNELSLHVNKVHLQIKPYSCDMCERQFYTESNLKYHKKVHSMSSKETCEFCCKTLNSRKQLVIHVRKHIGVKPFLCQICGQAFYSTYKTREHMKVYHGGKFCCRICKTTFVTKYGLKDHVHNEHGFI